MRNNKIDKTNGDAESEISVGLLGASFGTNNLGVAALTCGMVDAVCHSCSKARIFLIDYAKRPATYNVLYSGGNTKVELINIRFSKRVYLSNNIARLMVAAICFRILPLAKWKNRLVQQHLVLKTIHEANFIGSIAGGDSFSDIYGIGRLVYVALPQILVLLAGKPLVLLPQTIGPFKSWFGKTVARFILKHAWKVYSRDREGLDQLREFVPTVRNRMAFCYDVGFVLEPQILAERIPDSFVKHDSGIPFIGLNVSGLLYVGGYTKKNMFGLKVDYRRLILDLIDYFVNKHNARIMLVPHVIGSIENSESDTTACNDIYDESENRLKEHLYVINDEYDQHELKALIGRCDFFIGSRMHACIAALSQCIPAIGLAYSRKFQGVFASVGIDELVMDLRKHNRKYLMENVGRAYERRDHFRAQLKLKMPHVRVSIHELFAKIGEKCA